MHVPHPVAQELQRGQLVCIAVLDDREATASPETGSVTPRRLMLNHSVGPIANKRRTNEHHHGRTTVRAAAQDR